MLKKQFTPGRPNFAKMEEEVLQFWDEIHAFERSVEDRSDKDTYVFYDGPPFANGLPHYGHLLGSTAKDVIPRYQTMRGKRVERVWGWDCHGVPVENAIEKELGLKGGKKGIEELGIHTFNEACRNSIMIYDKEWKKTIRRLGRWVDMEHAYKTMDVNFMESVWWGFKQLYEKGLVYQGRKVILYCPRCSTPLSNFEIAMDNSYKEVSEASNTYKYKVVGEEHTYLLAWSTTPWNKLATPALAVNPDIKYVKVKQGDEQYILAHSRLSMLKNEPYEVEEEMNGKGLEKYSFELHYDFFPRTEDERAGVVIADSFVTAEEGTGIVTLAVYGEDDYRVMKQHHIQLVEHVDEQGKMKPQVTPFAGMYLEKVNSLVNEDLTKRGLMYQEFLHTHSVATCYRCGTRLYYAPLPAWFIDVQRLKPDLLKTNEYINWYPDHLKHGRFGKGIETAPDWNISRSRYWGTPMPIWESVRDGEDGLVVRRVIGSIEELKHWAVDPSKVEHLTDIHREYLDDVEVWVDDARTTKGKRIFEVFDCWVESGSMPFAQVHYPFEHKEKFDASYPAQFITEYIAQTRAWFYCMHVVSVGIFGSQAFENCLTTGTLQAEDGQKMSKSKKNYPDPTKLIDTYGSDCLRLYLMNSPLMRAGNMNFSDQNVHEVQNKVINVLWNIYGFYALYVQSQQKETTSTANYQLKTLHVLDRWLLSKTARLVQNVTTAMDAYDLVTATRLLMEFTTSFSTWYLRLSRERLKSGEHEESGAIFARCLVTLCKLFAPFIPFITETIYQNVIPSPPARGGDTEGVGGGSIHWTTWPQFDDMSMFVDEQLEEEMATIALVVEHAHAQRKLKQLKVRQPLASVTVRAVV
ncbi:isoleucine--tRNA ligase, partial [Candidatus Cerribacteria bacterium 'Amazon FNV 2010 28 9']